MSVEVKSPTPRRVDGGAGIGVLILLPLTCAVVWMQVPDLQSLVVGNETYFALIVLSLFVLSGSILEALPAVVRHRLLRRDKAREAIAFSETTDSSRHFKIAATDELASSPVMARGNGLDQTGACPNSPASRYAAAS